MREDPISVRLAAGNADIDAAFAIRRRVFQDEQGVPEEIEFDEDDRTAVHALAEIGGGAVGTGRVVVHGGEAKIGRMAVLREWRGRGVGRMLLDELLRQARSRGVRHVVLHAQARAVGFYEKAGFRACSEEFEEAGIPHRHMEKTVIGEP